MLSYSYIFKLAIIDKIFKFILNLQQFYTTTKIHLTPLPRAAILPSDNLLDNFAN